MEATKKEKKEITWDVDVQNMHNLKDDGTTVVAPISWNEGPYQINIRRCRRNPDGSIERFGKGIALTDAEVAKLTVVLNQMAAKQRGANVNFERVFEDAKRIVKDRGQM